MAMKRTTVWLTEEQAKRLAKVARSKGFKVAQVIRLYIAAGLKRDRA